MEPVTLGLIIGNRGFFPDHLCASGRVEMLDVLHDAGFEVVCVDPSQTRFGTVGTHAEARLCAELFATHARQIGGIVVSLPNFGDEKAVADAIRDSGLRVPVLVQAFPDDAARMTSADRRDGFCGKMSVCNNLRQYGIPFSLTRLHTVSPTDPSFTQDVADFAAVCRVVRGLRRLRIGALGARPTAFNTVRYSEKLLEKYGISVETLDLFEAFGRADRLKDDAEPVRAKRDAIRDYLDTAGVPAQAIAKMARFGVVVDEWMKDLGLAATAVQCWTAMEEYFGVVPCTVMSMWSNALLPSACEVDVTGAVAMYALAQAGGRPSALVDWNNNYGDDPDKTVLFHCSNLPRDLFGQGPTACRMDYQEIIAGAVGRESSYGTVVGRIAPAPFTYLRISTDDAAGAIRGYVGQGEFTNDPLQTFGGYGVARIRDLQGLLRYICENGFEHHVAVNPTSTATALSEALGKYLQWDVYVHPS